MQAFRFFLSTFDFKLGGITISPTYWQAIAIIVLIFILVLTLAQVRRHFLDWTAKGAVMGLIFGFLLTVVLEGFLILSGKTILLSVFGWQNAPKPIVNVLDAGRAKFSENICKN